MKKNNHILSLFVISVIWGGGCIMIKQALNDGMDAGILNVYRGLIFTVLVLATNAKNVLKMKKDTFIWGSVAGFFSFVSFLTQSIGQQYTTPAKAGFYVGTGVIMIPFIVWAARKIRPQASHIVSAFVCLFGMMILSGFIKGDISFNFGDALIVAAAGFYAVSLTIMSNMPKDAHYSQSAFCMAYTLFLGSFIYSVINLGSVSAILTSKVSLIPLLYLAVLSNFVAQTMQVKAARFVHPYIVSLITSTEGIFGAIFSILLGFEALDPAVVVGGLIIFLSLVISEMDFAKIKRIMSKTV